MSIAHVIKKGAVALTQYLKNKAQEIGVSPDVITRTYNPEAIKSELTESQPLKIAVYVSDADVDEVDTMAVIGKKITLSVAIVKKLKSTAPEEIDAVAELFETLQNLLVEAQELKGEGDQYYQVLTPETGTYCDLEVLRDGKVALFIIHLDLQACASAEFQSVSTVQ